MSNKTGISVMNFIILILLASCAHTEKEPVNSYRVIQEHDDMNEQYLIEKAEADSTGKAIKDPS